VRKASEVACCTAYAGDPNVLDTKDGFDALYPPDWAKGQPYWGDISGRHGGGANVLFVDGHVRWLRRENAFTMAMFGL
jgi:prepilin-type processing-associated H-X9-DG protein